MKNRSYVFPILDCASVTVTYCFFTPVFYSSLMFCSCFSINLALISCLLLRCHSFCNSSAFLSLSIFDWMSWIASTWIKNCLLLTLVVLENLWPDYLVDGVGRHLVDQVPKLHIRLLGLRGILIGDGTSHGELLIQLRFMGGQFTDFFNSVLDQRLIRFER